MWTALQRLFAGIPTAEVLKIKLADAEKKIAELEKDKAFLGNRVRELLAQIKELRSEKSELNTHVMEMQDRTELVISPEERDILVFIASHPGRSREQIRTRNSDPLSQSRFDYHWHRLETQYGLAKSNRSPQYTLGGEEPSHANDWCELTQEGRAYLFSMGDLR